MSMMSGLQIRINNDKEKEQQIHQKVYIILEHIFSLSSSEMHGKYKIKMGIMENKKWGRLFKYWEKICLFLFFEKKRRQLCIEMKES